MLEVPRLVYHIFLHTSSTSSSFDKEVAGYFFVLIRENRPDNHLALKLLTS